MLLNSYASADGIILCLKSGTWCRWTFVGNRCLDPCTFAGIIISLDSHQKGFHFQPNMNTVLQPSVTLHLPRVELPHHLMQSQMGQLTIASVARFGAVGDKF